MGKKLTTEEFVKKAKKIHGDKYLYNKSIYINAKTSVEIICKKHGSFLQTPNEHVYGKCGCKKCSAERVSNMQMLDTNEFVKRATLIHNNKYDYYKSIYSAYHSKVDIICRLHGVFKQTPADHLNGKGCPLCAIVENHNKSRMCIDEFIKRSIIIHGNKYDYSVAKYGSNCDEKINIICKIHGLFKQSPYVHLHGSGCPKCNNSKGEAALRRCLKDLSISFIEQKKFDKCKFINNLLFDFYLPDINTCIEYDGEQHFKPSRFSNSVSIDDAIKKFENQQIKDNIKNKFCLNNNIKLVRIRHVRKDHYSNIMEILNSKLIH